MNVTEWTARLARPECIAGLVIAPAPPYAHLSAGAIYSLDVNSEGDILVWTVPLKTWPRGPVTITIIPANVLHNATVLSHVHQDWAVYDGDVVRINGHVYGLPDECWVSATMKAGSASPYLFDGYVSGRLVQFMPTDVRAIKRLEIT